MKPFLTSSVLKKTYIDTDIVLAIVIALSAVIYTEIIDNNLSYQDRNFLLLSSSILIIVILQ